MKDSEILREARKLIEDGQENYICHALQDIGINHPECYDQTESIQNWIKSMFKYSCISLATWLIGQGITIDVEKGGCENGSIRETRLRWLDWMIEYCELEEAGWIPWLGSETPPKTCSEVMFRSKGTDRPSCVYRWDHRDLPGDIIAYKP